mmetsp:Transcript_22037/g.34647  ORF Transcript_22037/g.34647 Transcript_22037/m.34647 type:complete len:92 (-) Transcript_22037:735-1010(-)
MQVYAGLCYRRDSNLQSRAKTPTQLLLQQQQNNDATANHDREVSHANNIMFTSTSIDRSRYLILRIPTCTAPPTPPTPPIEFKTRSVDNDP